MPEEVPSSGPEKPVRKAGERGRGDLQQKVTYLPDIHRLLPQAPEAEQGVLASFLLAPREVGSMCGERLIRPEHFHIPAHATLFGELLEMWDKNVPIDFITLCERLRSKGQLEAVGGAPFVTNLFTFLPTAANASHYLDMVQEKHTLRGIIRVCTDHAARSYDPQQDVASLLDDVEKEIFEIAKDRYRETQVNMRDQVMEAIHSIEALYANRGQPAEFSTGFAKFDDMTQGLHRGEMVVIAARPSMGKTAFAMNIAEHLAVDKKMPVAVFSLEMPTQQLVQRLLCSRARVNLKKVRDGFLSERDFPALMGAADKLAQSQMFIDDTPGLSILELRAKSRRLKSQHGIEAIFIDYLQLLRSTSRRAQDNRQLEIAEISGGIKALAKELNIPIMVLAQLNRKSEDRTGDAKGRPRLSDLRESGSIEQDADLVGLLVREEYYADNEDEKQAAEGKATLIIAKQRNGPVGDVPLTFLKEFTRFETAAYEVEGRE